MWAGSPALPECPSPCLAAPRAWVFNSLISRAFFPFEANEGFCRVAGRCRSRQGSGCGMRRRQSVAPPGLGGGPCPSSRPPEPFPPTLRGARRPSFLLAHEHLPQVAHRGVSAFATNPFIPSPALNFRGECMKC